MKQHNLTRILSVLFAVLMLAAVCSTMVGCSVAKSKKYRYSLSELEQYMSAPKYKDLKAEIAAKDLQNAYDSYRINAPVDIKVADGDYIQVKIKSTEGTVSEGKNVYPDDAEPKEETVWLTVGENASVLGEQEKLLLGLAINGTATTEIVDGSNVTKYEVTYIGRKAENGQIVSVTYTGYRVVDDKVEDAGETDENGYPKFSYEIAKKDDASDDIFDSNTSGSTFFLGSGLAIEDFEAGIVGMAIGTTKDIKATFPDDYSAEELQGKTVIFKVTLKTVKAAPVLNDDFVKTNVGYETVEEFKKNILDMLGLKEAWKQVNDSVDYADNLPEKEYNEYVSMVEVTAQSYNLSAEEYCQQYQNQSLSEYVGSIVKSEMLNYYIAKAENLKVTGSEMAAMRDELINRYAYTYYSYGLDYNTSYNYALQYVATLGDDYIYDEVLFDKVDDVLLANTTITEEAN